MLDVLERIAEHADHVAYVDDLSRPEWLEERRGGIGGSDAAAVCGLSNWQTPYSVWADKTRQVEVADAPSMRQRCGQLMEPVIAQLFTEDTGIDTIRYPWILRSKKWPFMLVNLDAVAASPEAVGEWKTADFRFKEEWEDEDGNAVIPDAYMIQGQHELAVTGLDRVYFGTLIGGNDFRVIEVERNDDLIENLVKVENDFWRLVQSEQPPAVDGSKPTSDTLKALYPESVPGSRIELPVGTDETIRRLVQAKYAVKRAEEERDALANQIKALLGEAEVGTLNGREVVTWKSFVVKEHVRKESVRRPLNPKL